MPGRYKQANIKSQEVQPQPLVLYDMELCVASSYHRADMKTSNGSYHDSN